MRRQVARYATESLPILFLADMSSQAEIRKLAIELRGAFESVDVLINDVSAIYARRERTKDGVEKTLAVNHLAPFLLTTLSHASAGSRKEQERSVEWKTISSIFIMKTTH